MNYKKKILLISINSIFDEMHYGAIKCRSISAGSTFSQQYNLLMLIENTLLIMSSHNYYKLSRKARGSNAINYFWDYTYICNIYLIWANNCESDCVCVYIYIYIYIHLYSILSLQRG